MCEGIGQQPFRSHCSRVETCIINIGEKLTGMDNLGAEQNLPVVVVVVIIDVIAVVVVIIIIIVIVVIIVGLLSHSKGLLNVFSCLIWAGVNLKTMNFCLSPF